VWVIIYIITGKVFFMSSIAVMEMLIDVIVKLDGLANAVTTIV
jgi:hypothetical protein